jgi:hypothetical protein
MEQIGHKINEFFDQGFQYRGIRVGDENPDEDRVECIRTLNGDL